MIGTSTLGVQSQCFCYSMGRRTLSTGVHCHQHTRAACTAAALLDPTSPSSLSSGMCRQGTRVCCTANSVSQKSGRK